MEAKDDGEPVCDGITKQMQHAFEVLKADVRINSMA